MLKKIKFNSPVILTFAAACLVALLLNVITGGWANRNLFCVYRSSMMNPLFWVRLFGHTIGHANWEHLSSNMLIILLVGPLLEEKYGSKNMAILFALTALLTGVIHVLLFSSGLLGASGIVFALIILSSLTSVKDGEIPITFILAVVVYLMGEVADGVFVQDNISNLTHIIGGIIGGGCGLLMNRRKING